MKKSFSIANIIGMILGPLFGLAIAFYCAFGSLNGTYMIVLKDKPQIEGTFFSIETSGQFNFYNLSVASQFRRKYPFIIFAYGPQGIIFLKES